MASDLIQAVTDSGEDIRCPSFAQYLDHNYTTDQWKCTREKFFIPKFGHFSHLQCHPKGQDHECIYLCGHSLGLQPRESVELCHNILTRWGTQGALSHCEPNEPFDCCDIAVLPHMALITGAEEDEIVVMNSLTVNLHLMLACFYNPTDCKSKIIHEDDIFSSDKFALDCAVRRHGLDPESTLISAGSTQESILCAINEHGSSVALVYVGTVQYLTGYRFNIAEIVQAAHAHDAMAGFDLAHSVGVTPLSLHTDDVDFAVWCTYKYLCGGPSSAGTAFIHQRHHKSCFPSRMDGWWSATPETRLTMDLALDRADGANGFRISHPNPFQCNLLQPVLKMICCELGMDEVYKRGMLLTEYLITLLKTKFPHMEMLTPVNPEQRGFHVAIKSPIDGCDACSLKDKLADSGVFVDVRKGYLRMSVHPMYTTFTELYMAVSAIQ